MSTFAIHSDPAPLCVDAAGSVRVGGTRVTLDNVLALYRAGESAESIGESFPTLSLGDIHAVIAYYHRHRQEVDEYLQAHESQADELERQIRASQSSGLTREELLERRRQMRASDDASAARG